jgi:hypothetical protein
MHSLKSELTSLETQKPTTKRKNLKPRRLRRAEVKQQTKLAQRKIG